MLRSLIAILLICSWMQAADAPPAPSPVPKIPLITAHPDSSGWPHLLADDLSNADFPPGIWSMKDGILTATKDINLWTKAEYGDCVIDLEFRLDSGTNSGLFLYNSDPTNWMPTTVEIQILDDLGKEWRNIPANWRCGGFFGHLAPRASLAKEPGAWNRMTTACRGSQITTLSNGALASDVDLDAWTDGKRNPDGSEIPQWLQGQPWATLPHHGRIGLQGRHADAGIAFRSLRIQVAGAGKP